MKLHEDVEAFRTLLAIIGTRIGIREGIVKKDYYIMMLLNELSQKQGSLSAYFKGGTALYMALI